MNQILSTTSSQKKETKKKKEKNRKSNNGNYEPNMVKKAVIIFSILLIVFAVVIISIKLVQIISDKNQNSKINNLNKPEITIERVNNDKINIKISYDEKISKISWWWNDDISQIEERNYDLKEFSETIPSGSSNVLHIEVTAADGKTTTHEETLTRDTATTIELNQIPETDNMEIIAKSENAIDRVVYYWNEEDSTTVPATGSKQKELKTTIELKRGTNTLHVIVTDKEGNTEEKEEMFHCVKEPVIDVEINLDQMLMIITTTHDMGFEKVEMEINGKELVYDENYSKYDGTETKLVFTAKLKPGIDNTVKVVAYSNEKLNEEENTSATYSGHKDLTNMNTEEE